MINVALVKGEDRKENLLKALELIKKDIKIGNKQLLLKPNFVFVRRKLSSSHVDCMRALLDFFSEFYKKKIIIGESASCVFKTNTKLGYKKLGYYKLKDEYDVELIDFNEEGYEEITINDSSGRDFNIKISKWLTDKNNYIVSAAKLKTHNDVVATLTVKNIVMGAPLVGFMKNDKTKVHQGYKQINLNLLEIAKHVNWDLGVIDGFRGMQGNGPIFGRSFDSKLAIVSKDCIAADRIGVEVMGIDASKIGYLNYMNEHKMGEYDLRKIKVLGSKLEDCKYKFKLHRTVEEQYGWK